jgi:hypothetical protein
MTLEEIEDLIDNKIAKHEYKVGIISGIVGSLLIFGIFHAFCLVR